MNPKTQWGFWHLYPLFWVMWLGIVFLPLTAQGLDIPPLTGRVIDQAQILAPADRSNLNTALAAHESKTSNQVAVLILPSLEGEPLEEFSHRVASAWNLGQKGTDNGVLLLVAIQERKIRVEVGYGLEGTLTDAKSAQIIRHEMVPRFRQGDYPGGISAGVQAILGTIEGTYTSTASSSPSESGNGGVWKIFGLAVLLGTLVGLFLGSRRRLNGSIIGMLLSFFVAFPAALWLGLLAGAVTSVLVSLFSKVGGSPMTNNAGWSWPGSSWPTGGSGGFGGESFGGGFGGGGGSFGGGGASGSW